MRKIEQKIKAFLAKTDIDESTFSAVLGALVVIAIGLLIYNYLHSIRTRNRITEEAAYTENTELSGKGAVFP
jgi:hypothetical protein